MPTIEPGSVVKMKSGGPLMTVINRDGDSWWCTWFGEGGMPQAQKFAGVVLKLVDQD